jgi:hypothetical protein
MMALLATMTRSKIERPCAWRLMRARNAASA